MFYTTIGSRETPAHIQMQMAYLGYSLSAEGHVIRSGGARGADAAFQLGSMATGLPNREIYLPNATFTMSPNGSKIPLDADPTHVVPTETAMISAVELLRDNGIGRSRIRPGITAQDLLRRDPVVRLFARNAFQVLGYNLTTPSTELIGYMPLFGPPGGSKIAFDLAAAYGIPTFNLARATDLNRFMRTPSSPAAVAVRRYLEALPFHPAALLDDDYTPPSSL